MWHLSLLSKTTGTRPSEIVGIDDEWAAYQFDQAVIFVGRYVHSKTNELDRDGKPLYDINDMLGDRQRQDNPVEELEHIQGIVVEKR
jgi:hypothetical protein